MFRARQPQLFLAGCAIFVVGCHMFLTSGEGHLDQSHPYEVQVDVPAVQSHSEGSYEYMKALLQRCGALCKTEAGEFQESLFFKQRNVEVDCGEIFSEDVFLLFGHGERQAPEVIPDQLIQDYTLMGKVSVDQRYFNQQYHDKTAHTPVWSKELVDHWIALAVKDELEGNYGLRETSHLKMMLSKTRSVQNGRILVIGSENPWVEATLLAVGASSVVTLEYGKIVSDHPAISTLTPDEFRTLFLAGKLGEFDAVVTFSSVEHSGLGRYGDALNPWGDVLEVARAHCVSKQNGNLVIAVMSGEENGDSIEFNAHRRYGSTRWPYLASNWAQVDRETDGEQRVYMFVKS